MLNTPFRFLDMPYFSASQNMAIDEALMKNFQKDDLPIFRLYSWDSDAFTIGKFQDVNKIENFSEYGKNFTRRVTGGGLLLHGFDISYSLILPTTLLAKKSVKESYEFICQFLLELYIKLGFEPNFAKDTMNDSLSKSAFCQVGFEPYDIIIKDKKIGGNAQKRTRELIYQHGSIPLHVDSRKHSGVSLKELGVKLDIEKLKVLIQESFENAFETTLKKSDFTEVEQKSFESLHVNKYDTKEWKYENISAKL